MPWSDIEITEVELAAFDRGFRRQARFYADENIEPVVIATLRRFGFRITAAAEAGLINRDDADHLAHAHRTDCILLTKDRDFLDNRKYPPSRCPGVVVLDIGPLTRDSLRSAIRLLGAVVRPYRGIWHRSKALIGRDYHMTIWQQEHDTGRWMNRRYRLVDGWRPQEWVEAERGGEAVSARLSRRNRRPRPKRRA